MLFQIRVPRPHIIWHAGQIRVRGVQDIQRVTEAHLSTLWPSGVMSTDSSFPDGVVTV